MSPLPVTTVLPWLSCHSCSVQVFLFSCPGCAVLAVLSLLSCSGHPLLSVLPRLTWPGSPIRLICPDWPVQLYCFGCHALCPAVMSWLFYQGCPVLVVLSQLSCPVMFWQACHLFPLMLFWNYCCPYCPLQLSCPGCPVPDALSLLYCPGCCHGPSFHGCPGKSVITH